MTDDEWPDSQTASRTAIAVESVEQFESWLRSTAHPWLALLTSFAVVGAYRAHHDVPTSDLEWGLWLFGIAVSSLSLYGVYNNQ